MERLILFAKRPRPGHVKTRLVPTLGPRHALGLYRAFLTDQFRFLGRLSRRYQSCLSLDGPWAPGTEDDRLLETVRRYEQGRGDLGDRLFRAFRTAQKEGASTTVIIGVDSPTLPERHVRAAFEALASGSDGIVSPAEDGGYVLIGLRRVDAGLFRNVPWGGPQVCRATIEHARSLGFELSRGEPWYDIDDESGLRRLAAEMTSGTARRRAPATASYLDALRAARVLPPIS